MRFRYLPSFITGIHKEWKKLTSDLNCYYIHVAIMQAYLKSEFTHMQQVALWHGLAHNNDLYLLVLRL